MSALRLVALRQEVCRYASRFDPALLSRDDAVIAAREWAAAANAASAASAMAAARVAECGPPREAGARDAADWYARETGTTKARAQERLRTGQTMRDADATRAAATSGNLSADQAAVITDAVRADPDAEQQLLAT